MARVLPSEGLRRLITGFLFGTTGALIALSPVGKESGAHINPIVSFGFRLMGKLSLKMTLIYIVAQLAGAIVGSCPLLLWGSMLSVKTKPATISVWVYDPNSMVNKSPFDQPFHEGVTIRSSFDFPVTIGGLAGHQGFVATYSTKNGTDFETLDDVLPPSPNPGTVGIKNNRYYFGYSINQYLYQSKGNPKEGAGLFGRCGILDGNPNPLYWSGFGGVGGTGLIPGRSRDTWGVGYYYDALSNPLKDAVSMITPMRNEEGWEVFYNFSVTPWLELGANLEVIRPALGKDMTVFTGLRSVIRF